MRPILLGRFVSAPPTVTYMHPAYREDADANHAGSEYTFGPNGGGYGSYDLLERGYGYLYGVRYSVTKPTSVAFLNGKGFSQYMEFFS